MLARRLQVSPIPPKLVGRKTGRKERRNEDQETCSNRHNFRLDECGRAWAWRRDGAGQARATYSRPSWPSGARHRQSNRLAPAAAGANQAVLSLAVTAGSLGRRSTRDTVHLIGCTG